MKTFRVFRLLLVGVVFALLSVSLSGCYSHGYGGYGGYGVYSRPYYRPYARVYVRPAPYYHNYSRRSYGGGHSRGRY